MALNERGSLVEVTAALVHVSVVRGATEQPAAEESMATHAQMRAIVFTCAQVDCGF